MSGANHRAASCAAKERFTSPEGATKIARRMMRRRGKKGLRLTPYKCRFCRWFHLGGH